MDERPPGPPSDVAQAFVAMAHRIVWCSAATVDVAGRPRTRILHPVWDLDRTGLVGRVATDPTSLKADHLRRVPHLSCSYWAPDQDTCVADCDTGWDDTAAAGRALWDRFTAAPPPLGYDPSVIPGWTAPDVPAFGVLVLRPWRLRVLPGSLMATGTGEILRWRAPGR